MAQRYILQLVPAQGTPKERPAFKAASRKEAFAALFALITSELENVESSTVVIQLFENNSPIAQVRIREKSGGQK